MTVHNHQVLTLLKPPLVRLIKDVTDHRMLRLQRDMVKKELLSVTDKLSVTGLQCLVVV
ncbi:hypothetical protein F2Q70_00030584 [Brassica cretica]|uniref:Uncharacterized protein n=1 Tax=Brassica cretica TaxID=69181 RepID=A0A8S9FFS0_BRACR|nr:hypothetical protein F2Q70_00030584 [Brassica cretica]